MDIKTSLKQLKELGGIFSFAENRRLKTAGHVYIGELSQKNKEKLIISTSLEWQQQSLLNQIDKEVIHFVGESGPIWIVSKLKAKNAPSHGGQLEESAYSWYRDQVGGLLSFFKAYRVENVFFNFFDDVSEIKHASLVGLEMAAYNYKNLQKPDNLILILNKKEVSKKVLDQAHLAALSINICRHLVNLPPNILNPKYFAQFAAELFKDAKNTKLNIWDEKKLKAENMNLHLAVGEGSNVPPMLVHLQYRPKNSAKKPFALVGKGVTFDTGGVDIKPSSGMRLMKKDMGGAAAALATMYWATQAEISRPLDAYLPLAENSVDGNSFRPSDILMARNGLKIEIHNTDAEGRLLLADSLDLAVSQKGKDEPELVIDIATLTGAIKVALGAEVAGLFVNDDRLAEKLQKAGQLAGDLNWRMPLFTKYNSMMGSAFADYTNATDGFAGAVTAALFLEKFVQKKPWAHLDIYAWADKSSGAISGAGGNGQGVQCLIEFLNL